MARVLVSVETHLEQRTSSRDLKERKIKRLHYKQALLHCFLPLRYSLRSCEVVAIGLPSK